MTMLIIINADDLGLSTAVNEAIFDLMERGHITSSSLFANAPATEEAIIELRQHKNWSFGVHLNVTAFRPLTRSAALSPILDNSGGFTNSIRLTPITSQLREAIFQEWSAQIERLLAMGLTPSHIDLEQHVHTIPDLFFVLKRVQRRFGIRKARISKNIYPTKAQAASLVATAQDGLERCPASELSHRHYQRLHQAGGFLRCCAAPTNSPSLG